VRVNEELLERKVAAPFYKNYINDRRGSAALTKRHPSFYKSWHKISSTSGGRSVGIVRLWTKGHGVCLFCCSLRFIKIYLYLRYGFLNALFLSGFHTQAFYAFLLILRQCYIKLLPESPDVIAQ
jgi:hypothetical protein